MKMKLNDDKKQDEIMEKNGDDLQKIEIIIGLFFLIVLIVIAIILLTKKDSDKNDRVAEVVTEEERIVATPVDEVNEVDEAAQPVEDTAVKATDIGAVVSPTVNKTSSEELPQVFAAGRQLEYTGDTYQLPELYAYWNDYKLEAVQDIIHLERFRPISAALSKTNDFYYYGETSSDGKANGTGLAVYANDTYYFGEWKNGMRSGSGTWLREFIDAEGTVNGVTGVIEHQYSGTWAEDYPCGEGQENFTYNYDTMSGNYIIVNAIGAFKDGYYNGDMYIQTTEGSYSAIDWYGTAQMGSFKVVDDVSAPTGSKPIWKAADNCPVSEQDGCRWINAQDNFGFGIAGLKKQN